MVPNRKSRREIVALKKVNAKATHNPPAVAENSGDSDNNSNPTQANTKNRIEWEKHPELETALLEALGEPMAIENRSDNGWKAPAWNHVAVALKHKYPAFCSGINGQKCRGFFNRRKAEYRTVKELRSMSGFGWNSEEMHILCSDASWNELMKTNAKKYTGWRSTPFLHYDAYMNLTDHSTATGNRATNGLTVSVDDEDQGDNSDGSDLEVGRREYTETSEQERSDNKTTGIKRSVSSSSLPATSHISKRAKGKTTNAQALVELGKRMEASSKAMVSALTPYASAIDLLYREHSGDLTVAEITTMTTVLSSNIGLAQAFGAIPTAEARVNLIRSLLERNNVM